MTGKSPKKEKGPGQSKISIDNDEQISAQNATREIEQLAHETIIKGKTIMISPNGKGQASYTQDRGETDVGPNRHRERLFQYTQMDEPVLVAPAIPLKIL
jgi:hypothetical protein